LACDEALGQAPGTTSGETGRAEREAEEDLEALEHGEIDDLGSHKRTIRDEYTEEGFPSAGAGYLPPP
jgi:hypothetical protein